MHTFAIVSHIVNVYIISGYHFNNVLEHPIQNDNDHEIPNLQL